MTKVNIKGTFSKDSRPHNGLEPLADQLIRDPYTPIVVVGIVRPHSIATKVGEDPIPTVEVVAIEAITDTDGRELVRNLLDKAAAARGVPVPDPLPLDDIDEE